MAKIESIKKKIRRAKIKLDKLKKEGDFNLKTGQYNGIIVADLEYRISKWIEQCLL